MANLFFINQNVLPKKNCTKFLKLLFLCPQLPGKTLKGGGWKTLVCDVLVTRYLN